jgi:uncharacterized protein (TIGR02611 family)
VEVPPEGGRPGPLASVSRRVVATALWVRTGLRRHPFADAAYRLVLGVVGCAVVALGIVLLPAPGPGWAVIFLGLGILAAAFGAARKVLAVVRSRYHAWIGWVGRRSRSTRVLLAAGLGLLVLGCSWLLGTFALVGSWLALDWPWLAPPLAAV